MAGEAARLFISVGADIADATRGLDSISNKISGIGRTAAAQGALLSAGLTAPLAGITATVLKTGSDFESAFAGVRKTVDGTEEQLSELRQGIRDMAGELPASAVEIAGVAEAAGQLGIKTENVLDFTRVMIDLGNSTNLSGDAAATALARLANITQMPQDQFDRLGSTVVALGNNLATTEAEIVEMGLRLAGAGSQVGMTEAETLALAGALSSVGIAAESGGTALSRVMIDIASAVADGGEKLDAFADVAGMSGSEFATAFKTDAAGAIVTFIEGLGRLSDEGENVFAVLDDLELGEIRVRDALLRASGAGDLFRDALELGTRAWEENNALTKEAAQRYETVESQSKALMNRISGLATSFYDKLRPGIVGALGVGKDVLTWLERLVGGLDGLDPRLLNAAIAFGAVLAAAGPLLLAFGGLATLLGFLLSPLGLVVLGVGALAALFAGNVGGIQGILPLFASLVELVADFASGQADLGDLQDWWNEWSDNIGAALGEAGAALVAWVGGLGEQVPLIAAKLAEWGEQFIAWVFPAAGGLLTGLGELALRVIGWAAEQVGPLANTLWGWALAFMDWLIPVIPQVLDGLLGLVSDVVGFVIDKGPELLRTVIGEWVPALIGFVAQAALDIIPRLVAFLGDVSHWIIFTGVPELLALGVRLGLALLDGIKNGLGDMLGLLGEALGIGGGSVAGAPPIHAYAHGGIISEPVVGFGLRSGHGYTFGEGVREAVVPLNGSGGSPAFGRAGGGGGAPVIVQINAPVYGFNDFEDAVMRAVENGRRRGRV